MEVSSQADREDGVFIAQISPRQGTEGWLWKITAPARQLYPWSFSLQAPPCVPSLVLSDPGEGQATYFLQERRPKLKSIRILYVELLDSPKYTCTYALIYTQACMYEWMYIHIHITFIDDLL